MANAVADAFIELQQQSAQSAFQRAQQELARQGADTTSRIDALNSQIARLEATNPASPDLPTLRLRRDALLATKSSADSVSTQLTQQYVITSENIRVFQPAVPPTQPDHPRPLTYAFIGGVAGLVLATGVVLLWRDTLDRWSVRMIPSMPFGRRRHEIAEDAPAAARPTS